MQEEELRRKKKKEEQKKKDEEDMKYLEEQSKENIVEYSSERKTFNFAFAIFTTLLPAYLYQGVLNMTLTPFNLVVYALVSVFAAYFLSISYQNNFFKVRARIAVRFEKTLDETNTKLSTNQREFVKNEKGRLTDLASSGQALALSNLIYILSVLAFTFYFFKNVVPVANYALSCSLASGLAYLLSTSSAKKKDKKKK